MSREESRALPPGSLLWAAQVLALDMKRQLQESLAALESAEADTRDGASRFVRVLHLVGNESAPELSDPMGDDCGEDFDFDGNLTT